MEWQPEEVVSLSGELVACGLATANPYGHLALNPALCPYLRARLADAERDELNRRWQVAMYAYVGFLIQQQSGDAAVAATLTGLELPNLLALLEGVQGEGNAAATIDLTTSLYSLLKNAGRPRLLERIGQARGEIWNHARCAATIVRIEQQLAGGQSPAALASAQALLARARAVGEQAYPYADYDLATACWLLARVLRFAGQAQPALSLFAEARQRFEMIETRTHGRGAEHMDSTCLTETGDCLLAIGRFDDAAAVYEAAIARHERRGDRRGVAVGKGQLGTVRLRQRRYDDALTAYEAARAQFAALDESGSVAMAWHQLGMTHQKAGRPQVAEDAYRQSLAIEGRLGHLAGQAATLGQLGTLYAEQPDRLEDAVACCRQAIDKYVELGDLLSQGIVRDSLAETLRRLGRRDEARREIRQAIVCQEPFGHAAEPWKSWSILANIERDTGDVRAAAEARERAIAAFLAYRRDGGENHDISGRLALAVGEWLRDSNAAEAARTLQQVAADADIAGSALTFIRALQAIAAGSRDPALAEAPDLSYTMVAEILLLLEALP